MSNQTLNGLKTASGAPVSAHYVEAPHVYRGTRPGVFLAGGISECPDWQAEATSLLTGLPIVIFNPRRNDFPIRDPRAGGKQIRWEFAHLAAAQVVLFWFPVSGRQPQPIALYELGRHVALGRTLAVGADSRYIRRQDVLVQLGLACPAMPIHDSLEQTCRQAANLLNVPGKED